VHAQDFNNNSGGVSIDEKRNIRISYLEWEHESEVPVPLPSTRPVKDA
jgi:hypothetical protein